MMGGARLKMRSAASPLPGAGGAGATEKAQLSSALARAAHAASLNSPGRRNLLFLHLPYPILLHIYFFSTDPSMNKYATFQASISLLHSQITKWVGDNWPMINWQIGREFMCPFVFCPRLASVSKDKCCHFSMIAVHLPCKSRYPLASSSAHHDPWL